MKLSNQELIYILEGLSIFRDDLKEDSVFDYYAVWGLMDDVRIELNKR